MTKTKKVGFIGGMNVPLIHKFEAGYRAGVKHVAPDVEVIVNYAGETPKAFQDPETGKNRALEQYKSGVEIIFHASGKTGLGVFQAAKEEKKLASTEHREAIARAIYASLAEYKRRYDQRVHTVQTHAVKAETSR